MCKDFVHVSKNKVHFINWIKNFIPSRIYHHLDENRQSNRNQDTLYKRIETTLVQKVNLWF